MPCPFTTNDVVQDDYTNFIVPLRREPTPMLDCFGIGQAVGDKTDYVKWAESRQGTDRVLAPLAIGAAATTIDFGVLSGNLQPGTVVMVGGEHIVVDSQVGATNVWNVTRGYASTAAVAHAAGVTILLVSHSNKEGCSDADCKLLDKVQKQNVLQEFSECICFTDRLLRRGGRLYDDLRSEETLHAVERMARKLDNAVMYGIYDDSSAQGRYTLGGIRYYLNNGIVDNLGGAALTEDAFKDFLGKLALVGSNADTIVVSTALKAYIVNNFAGYSKQTCCTQGEVGLSFGQSYDSYISDAFDGRVLRFKTSRFLLSDELYVIDSRSIVIHPGKNTDGSNRIFWLAKETNTCEGEHKWTLRTELTLTVIDCDRQGYMTNFTTP